MATESKDCYDMTAVVTLMVVESAVIPFLVLLLLCCWIWRKRSRYAAVKKCHVEGDVEADATSSRFMLSGYSAIKTCHVEGDVEENATSSRFMLKVPTGHQRTILNADCQRLEREDEENRTKHPAEVNELESKIKALQEKLRGQHDEVERLKSQIQTQKQSISAGKNQHKILQEEINRISQEKDDALLRLSENMAVQLTYENPNVTDLSDENRPNKLSERLSELYDNQYTDAQQILEDKFKNSYSEDELTKRTAQFLLHMLQSAFAVCQEIEEKQMTRLRHILKNPVAEPDPSHGEDKSGLEVVLPKTLMKAFKDKRKTVEPDASLLRQKTLLRLKQVSEPSFAETADHEVLRKYMDESIKICWLMCIQDPPMYLEFREMHDKNIRKFTRSGEKFEYYIWPSVYLHKGGSLMGKGIAQFSRRNNRGNFY